MRMRPIPLKPLYVPPAIEQLTKLAKMILEDKELDNWLFTHTLNVDHYHQLVNALSVIANARFVEWVKNEQG